MEDRREACNPPEDALLDVEIAEAVSVSAREQRMVSLARAEFHGRKRMSGRFTGGYLMCASGCRYTREPTRRLAQ